MIGGYLGGEDGGLASGASNIDLGLGTGDFTFMGVRGQNPGGAPIITGSGTNAKIHSLGNRWLSQPFTIDTTKSLYYDNVGDSNIGSRINTGLGLTLQTVLGGNLSSGSHSPPLNFEHTGQISHAISNYAVGDVGADGGNTSALQMVQTSGAAGAIVQGPQFAGGISTVAATARTIASVAPVGATGATSWAYSVVGYANNGLTFVYPTVSISNGAATLDATHYNHIDVHTSGEFWKYCLRREIAGGTPNTRGLLSTAGPLSNGCVVATNAPAQNPPSWGYGGDQHIHFYDTGFSGDASATPTKTADGSVNIPAGACFKKNGACLTAVDVSALPGTFATSARDAGAPLEPSAGVATTLLPLSEGVAHA
jgi:hypothetical protein